MATRGVYDDNYASPAAQLPFSQYNTTAQGNGTTLSATICAGACENVVVTSGATALNTPVAADMINAVKSVLANTTNLQYRLRIINTNAGTLTLTAGTGCTIPGTKTLATNTWREYDITVSDHKSCTWNSIGTGTYS